MFALNAEVKDKFQWRRFGSAFVEVTKIAQNALDRSGNEAEPM